jgi:signal transduction histidine kinase
MAALLIEGLIRTGVPHHLVVILDDASRGLLLLAVAWANFRRARTGPRSFADLWQALGWSMLLLGVATLYLVLTHDILGLRAPIPTFRHLGYFLGMGFLAQAVLRLPVESFLPSQRAQAVLDGLLISTAVFFIAWGGFLRHLVESHASPGNAYALTLAYPLLSTALGALWMFQESRIQGRRLGVPGLFMRLGLAVMVAWWPFYAIGNIQGWYRNFGISEQLDVLWSAGILCFGLAAMWPLRPQGNDLQVRSRRRQSFVPYTPSLLAMTYGAFLLLRGHTLDPVMVATGTVLGIVLTLRQYLTVRDLDNLSVELEHRVLERTGELMRSQQELAKSQRSQLIAGMAAGFAHDLKNMLGVIRNWVEILREGTTPQEASRGLGAIDHATDKALGLVQDILAAGRLQDLTPETFDLAEFLRERASSLEGLLGSRGVLELDLPAESIPVHLDPGKLEQALANLTSNSADAMDQLGTLTFRAWNDPVEAFGNLEVSDTGKGIATENLERIFEPFFTTKPSGKGTGLGLSSVYGTVLQSGGTMAVRSKPGRGTVFTLRLPRTQPARSGA